MTHVFLFASLLLPSLACSFPLIYTLFMQNHVEGYLELSAKTKTYFATAVNLWDADFYVKVDDDVHVNIGITSSKNLKISNCLYKISMRGTFLLLTNILLGRRMCSLINNVIK